MSHPCASASAARYSSLRTLLPPYASPELQSSRFAQISTSPPRCSLSRSSRCTGDGPKRSGTRSKRSMPMRRSYEVPRAARTAGATSRPRSSIERRIPSCGIPPIVNCTRKRSCPKISCWKRIFSTICSGVPDEVRAAERRCGVVVGAHHRRPPALLADLVHRGGDVRERLVERLLRRVRDVAMRVDAESRRLAAGLGGGAAMELGERLEALREPADDRERHRQAEHPRAHGRLRRASDGDPHGQRLLHRRREHRRSPLREVPVSRMCSSSASFSSNRRS